MTSIWRWELENSLKEKTINMEITSWTFLFSSIIAPQVQLTLVAHQSLQLVVLYTWPNFFNWFKQEVSLDNKLINTARPRRLSTFIVFFISKNLFWFLFKSVIFYGFPADVFMCTIICKPSCFKPVSNNFSIWYLQGSDSAVYSCWFLLNCLFLPLPCYFWLLAWKCIGRGSL